MFPQIPADLSTLSSDELNALLTECRAAYAEARPNASTPEAIQALTEFAAAVANVQTEATRREAEAAPTLSAEQQAALDALDAQFGATGADGGTQPNTPEGGDNAPNGEGEGGEGQGEDEPAETLSPDQITDLVNTAVTAALATRPARTRPRPAAPATLAQMQARLAPELTPLTRPAPAPFTITAAADVPGVALGAQLSQQQLAEAFVNRARDLGQGRGGPDDKVPVASFNIERGPERTLSDADFSFENDRKIREYREEREEAIVAAGGLCAPVDNRYEQMVISEAWRPIMGGAIPTFTSARGGLKQVPPPSLADITSGVGTVTAAQDLAGGAGAVKNCFVVTCAAATEDVIEADYVCVEFGNFGARTFPEQVEAWMQLAAAAHARQAETNRLNDLKNKSAGKTSAGLVGAGREILNRFEQAQQVINSAARRPQDAPVEVILPQWVLGLIRADLTRTLTDADTIGLSDQEILAMFGQRHMAVTLTPDSATGNGQILTFAAGAGALSTYPSTVFGNVFVPGTFIGIDSGRLDLGLVRDSTLTMGSGTTPGNRFRMFYENFEALSKVGPVGSAMELALTVCADGSYGPAKAITCPTGVTGL